MYANLSVVITESNHKMEKTIESTTIRHTSKEDVEVRRLSETERVVMDTVATKVSAAIIPIETDPSTVGLSSLQADMGNLTIDPVEDFYSLFTAIYPINNITTMMQTDSSNSSNSTGDDPSTNTTYPEKKKARKSSNDEPIRNVFYTANKLPQNPRKKSGSDSVYARESQYVNPPKTNPTPLERNTENIPAFHKAAVLDSDLLFRRRKSPFPHRNFVSRHNVSQSLVYSYRYT